MEMNQDKQPSTSSLTQGPGRHGARQTWYPGMRLQSAEPNTATSASSGQQDPERTQLSTGLRDEEGVQEKEREGCFGQRAEHPRGL